ncbi:MAG: ABC transporter substrate-binding protein [Candidatus Korarchaeum sp.]|nr:ABC transporter substrate-binding protein [Candidatus Korarchaeum sp.]
MSRNVMYAILSAILIALLLPAFSPVSAAPVEFKPNKYGWFDSIVFFGEPDHAKAVEMLIKGDMDVYFIDLSEPDLYRKIKQSPELAYDFSFGLYYDLTFNPVGPTFPKTGELNPFSNKKIREAMNYIIDRDYIVNEILGGLGMPKFVPFIKLLPEGQRYLDVISKIESKYAYDFEKGKAIIESEMKKMGAELVGGKWYYKGKPVTLHFIIRVEDARRAIGDYISNQLERLGFTVDRMYKTSREASPLWIRGDPAEGKWHLYTGGWITTAVSRDDSDNFQFFYTPDSPMAWSPLWRAYKPDSEFRDIANKLAMKQFKTMEERDQMMRKALWMAIEDSARLWIVDQTAVWARRKGINLVADYAAGYAAASWAFTANKGKVGGTARISSAEVIIDPWNPSGPNGGASNWIYDVMIYGYALTDSAFLLHPQTGLAIPLNVKSVYMEVVKGTPTHQNEESKNWLTLKWVDSVKVPPDAWASWDVKGQRMVTAKEANVTEAKVKFVVNYGPVLGKVAYHDGSIRSLADFIFGYVVDHERMNPESKIYDESVADYLKSFYEPFKAWRIISTDPLVIEYYVDYIHLDAELIASAYTIWPSMPWHSYFIGVLAEENKELAFGADKANALNVEWMNYIAGPSLEILKKYLDKAYNEGLIPYPNFFKDYIKVEEAKRRYSLLRDFYNKYKHFFISDGPYYLAAADAIAHTCTIKSIRTLPYKIEKIARDIEEFKLFPYTFVGIGYDKSIILKYFPTAEVLTGPSGVSLVVGGPAVNVHTKLAFEKAGIKMDHKTLSLPTGEKYESKYGSLDYGIATLIDKNLYVAGTSRYGTEAALLYLLKNKVNAGTIIVKWQDTNRNGAVDENEISLELQKP